MKPRIALYHNVPLNLEVKSVLLKMDKFEVKIRSKQTLISIWLGYQC